MVVPYKDEAMSFIGTLLQGFYDVIRVITNYRTSNNLTKGKSKLIII